MTFQANLDALTAGLGDTEGESATAYAGRFGAVSADAPRSVPPSDPISERGRDETLAGRTAWELDGHRLLSEGCRVSQMLTAVSARRGCSHTSGRLASYDVPAPEFAHRLLGWKPSSKNKLRWPSVPNNADVDNRESLVLGQAMLDAMGDPTPGVSAPPNDPGGLLESRVREDLEQYLIAHLPDREWSVKRGAVITNYSQYVHLLYLNQLVANNPTLSITIGRDYLIKPDVVVGLAGVPTMNSLPLLHAAVSCKWTIRSDRVQNIRHENNQMVRHRRGRQPHLVTVTAEPLPSRLASIARGTGEVDAVYHLTYDELHAAVQASSNLAQQAAWNEITGQHRLLDYNLLGSHLASW